MGKKSRKKNNAAATDVDVDAESLSEASIADKDAVSPGGGNATLVNAGRILLLLATAIALYLVVIALSQGQAAGCEEGSSCDTVLSSKWAKLFGAPIGAFGAAAYVGMIGLSFASGMRWAQMFLVISIVGGALWFTGVQAFALKTFCPWCCTTHALAALGAVSVFIGLPRIKEATTSQAFFAAAGVAAVFLTAVIQINAPDPVSVTVSAETETESVVVEAIKRDFVEVHEKFKLSTVDLPSMGNAQTAEHVAVGMFDFSCSHCRKLMKILKPVVSEYGDRLAILKLPGFYNKNGQEIQKLMLPVFREAPEIYEELGNALYAEKVEAKVAVVRQELEKRLGSQRLEQIVAMHSQWTKERLDECEAVKKANEPILKNRKLPQLMVGKVIESGNRPTAAHYHQMFAKNFGLARDHAPELVASLQKIDLGKVVASSQHTISFTLSNPGSVPVKIEGIRRPKGMRLNHEPKGLAPGETATIQATMIVPEQKSGSISTGFEIHSNGSEPVIRIPLIADVINIQLEPALLNFGSMEAGGEAKELTATITLGAAAKLTSPASQSRFFTLSPIEEVEPGKVYRIKVSAQFDKGIKGYRNSFVTVRPQPKDPATKWPEQIRIQVKARIVAPAPAPQ